MFRYEEEGIPLISRVRKRWIPTRVSIGIMMFTACWANYMLRLQMPILAVPMIKARATAGSNVSSAACEVRVRRAIAWLDPGIYLEDYILAERLEAAQNAVANSKAYNIRVRRNTKPIRPSGIYIFNGLPFDWRPEIRGQLIAAYSYGNVPGNLLGGMMAVKWGAKNAILWTSIVAVLISFFSPILAQFHWGVLLVSRMVIGLTGGITFPACHSLVARWAPPNEKARFVWSLLGGTFGTIFTYPLVAGIAQSLEWENGWYIPSLLIMVWIFFWALITYDSPEEHPGISAEEKEYIITEQAGTVRKVKPTLKQTPLKEIFTSIPFLSLIVCHFGNMFLLFFYQNAMMIYLTKALGFKLTKGGVAAALPWLFRMVFGFFFSWAGDTLKKKKILSVTAIRKGATIFSHFLPGIFFILVGYVGCRFVLANIFLMLALGFNGAASISNLSNNQDLSPNFAGFLYGIMNTIGCTSGFIISPLVEEIAGKYGILVVVTTRGYYSSLYHQIYSTRSTHKTHHQNPIERWQTLFWIGAGVCIVCMIVFVIGGSGNIQPWNEVQVEAEEPET